MEKQGNANTKDFIVLISSVSLPAQTSGMARLSVHSGNEASQELGFGKDGEDAFTSRELMLPTQARKLLKSNKTLAKSSWLKLTSRTTAMCRVVPETA